MSLLLRKITPNNIRNVAVKSSDVRMYVISTRKLSFVPSLYDGEQDPAPKFFSQNVQVLLKRLTRPDYAKIFRKRTNSGLTRLKTPNYKFLTNEELEVEIAKAQRRANKLLQIPPVVKIHKPINDILSKDPALVGYDDATFMFTDISFGVDNAHRVIVQRDPDGTLHACDHDIRKRLNQVYFPINGRKIREPLVFSDEEKLYSVLDSGKYEYVLDRACIQYEPDEPAYQKVTSITYQHVDAKSMYDVLRSTRHFGSMAFYLTWHQTIDSLLLELLQGGAVREAVLLTALRQEIHGDVEVAEELVKQILPTPILLTKQETVTEEDIQLDTKCVDCIAKYITTKSSMKSQQELALQGFREYYQHLITLSQGLKKAHGA